MSNSIGRRQCLVNLAAPVALFAIAGCAAQGRAISPEADKAALLERARAYWGLVQRNDNIAAWAYEAASKDPGASLEEYLKRGGVTFDALEVRDVRRIDGDRAVVDLWIRYSLPLLRVKRMEATVEDEWQRIDGVWHHILRRSVMFPKDAK